MIYKQELTTKNITPWKNTKQFIALHHTATNHWSIKWVLNTLTIWKVSCHYVVDELWNIYKIWSDDNILWHLGISSWGNLKDMNKYAIWIEIVWWLNNPFTDEQRKAVKELVLDLMNKYNIPKENVLRHKDFSPWRKTDVADSFWNNEFKTYQDYQNNLISKNKLMEDIRESAKDFLKRDYTKEEKMKDFITKEDLCTILERILVKNSLK